MTDIPQKPSRIESLDQFRGYTVVGMLLVNFIGGYQVVPAVLKHHNTYCSYADTIMPQFFFAVGFAYRLTFLRRLENESARTAIRAVLKRSIGLLLLGFVIYHIDGSARSWRELQSLSLTEFLSRVLRRELFQTLVHIALTSILVLPVIAANTIPRVIFMAVCGGLHLWLSHLFYIEVAWRYPVIDGGPLGILTWTIPLLVGSLAYDLMVSVNSRGLSISKLAVWSSILMLLGYAISCAGGQWASLPFVEPAPNPSREIWTMSQRAGSLSYLTFSAGFSLAIYALFVATCDVLGWRSWLFQIYGQNALTAYLLHPLVASAIKPYVPNDVPLWYLALGFGLYFAICTLFINYLAKNRIFLRL